MCIDVGKRVNDSNEEARWKNICIENEKNLGK